MRVFLSLFLAGGLLLIGLQIREARMDARQAAAQPEDSTFTTMEDGTGFPPPR